MGKIRWWRSIIFGGKELAKTHLSKVRPQRNHILWIGADLLKELGKIIGASFKYLLDNLDWNKIDD